MPPRCLLVSAASPMHAWLHMVSLCCVTSRDERSRMKPLSFLTCSNQSIEADLVRQNFCRRHFLRTWDAVSHWNHRQNPSHFAIERSWKITGSKQKQSATKRVQTHFEEFSLQTSLLCPNSSEVLYPQASSPTVSVDQWAEHFSTSEKSLHRA